MADFDEDFLESPRFPDCISQGSIGGPGFLTEIVIQNSGVEKRTKKWSQRRGQYNAAYGARTMPDVEELIAFCHVLRGRAIGFRFKDWSDYKSCSVLDTPAMDDQELVRISAGVYQLVKVYDLMGATYTRDIVKPVDGTVLIAAGGVLQVEDTDYEVDYTSGRVTFFTDPEDESPQVFDITGGFEFDVPCRFDIDELPINMRTKEIMGMDIPLVELKLPPPAEVVPYATTASDYDGSTNRAERGGLMTGLLNSAKGTISMWFRCNGFNPDPLRGQAFFSNVDGGDFLGTGFVFARGGTGSGSKMIVYASDAADINNYAAIMVGLTTITAGATWRNLLLSWDSTILAQHMYLDDVDDRDPALDFLMTADALCNYEHNAVGYQFGGLILTPGNTDHEWIDDCVSEFFFHPTYIDLSVEANRRKFISAVGKPVDLGADGSTPLGVQPIAYYKVGDPAQNLGTGGNMVNEAVLNECDTSPTD